MIIAIDYDPLIELDSNTTYISQIDPRGIQKSWQMIEPPRVPTAFSSLHTYLKYLQLIEEIIHSLPEYPI